MAGTLGLLGSIAESGSKAHYREVGEAGIAACTTVLASGYFDDGGSWERHVNILRARAIHYLEVKNGDAALADLQKIDEVAGSHADDIFYQRSLGLSVKYLEGVALIMNDNADAARGAFKAFSDMRPYSKNLQSLGLKYMTDDRLAVIERMVRLDSDYLYLHATLLDIQDGQEVKAAENWAHLVAGGFRKKASYKTAEMQESFSGLVSAKDIQIITTSDPVTIGMAAIAAARVGQMAQAEAFMEQAKTTLVGAPEKQNDREDIIRRLRRLSTDNAEDLVGMQDVLVKAYGQYYNRDLVGARDTLVSSSKKFPVWPALLDLLEKLQRIIPEENRLGLMKVDVEAAWFKLRNTKAFSNKTGKNFVTSLFERLPSLEKKSQMNSYSGKVWFFKGSGFSEKELGKDRYEIKFVGDVSSRTVVEELSLLRAADLARQSKKTGFIISDITNYTRTRYSTYNGVRMGAGTPAGYMTSLTVTFVDPDKLPDRWIMHKGRILMTDKVWQDLSSVYVKSKN
ncbi:hypothetical protein CRD36_15325 [Paremcibacter congregatus]|uniref:Uncharacterized protein n=2 Tax=Paremcibacter congregatus TaxID=2043170 RepID=A0A2G4YN52_9PROT|nr:hypothetical protein CRD36_15325 [Paremcibacter congregatus]